MDAVDPEYHEELRHGPVQRDSDGQAGTAERDSDVFCVFGESG